MLKFKFNISIYTPYAKGSFAISIYMISRFLSISSDKLNGYNYIILRKKDE